MPKLKLTKTTIERLVLPPDGQVLYLDTALPGFGVRLTRGARSYFVEKRIAGKTVRLTLGRHRQIGCEAARKLALAELGRMTSGVHPQDQRKAARARSVTLTEAFGDFLEARKTLKPTTLRTYTQVMRLCFADWNGRPIAEITKDMVASRHAKIGVEHGRPYANLAMRVLRSVLNFASNQYEDSKGLPILPDNPVQRLSRTKAWFKVPRRQTIIPVSRLAAWFQAVDALGAEPEAGKASTVRDYLLLILFTGLRREEAARLRWQDVDLKARTLTVPDTKNGEPLTLPLSTFLVDLLEHRRRYGVIGYVFPGDGEAGHLVEPKREIDRVRVACGFHFTVHDLRRTFITIAESLDISAYALKRLVNHKMGNDVTAGYIVYSVERLRRPMEEISAFMVDAIRGASATNVRGGL